MRIPKQDWFSCFCIQVEHLKPFNSCWALHWHADMGQNKQGLTDSEGEVCSAHDYNSIPAASKAKNMHQ